MGTGAEGWARKWLEEQRAAGEKGLTLEKRGEAHYLFRSTTKWVKGEGKRRKISKYLGRLDRDGTVVPPEGRVERVTFTDLRQHGNMAVLAKASAGILGPLREAFPDLYQELLALAFLRCLGKGTVAKASRQWGVLDDVLGLRPRLGPVFLSEALRTAGGAREAQLSLFSALSKEERYLAVDMSVCFSRSRGAFILKKGYNRFRLTATQFNILLACGLESGRPMFMKTLAGNVRENSVFGLLKEFGIDGKAVLVMDWGYFSAAVMDGLKERSIDFVIAAKRNSSAYRRVDVGDAMFRWRDRVVRCGKADWKSFFAYRYEDPELRNGELWDKLKARDEKGTEPKDVDKAGNIVLVSSLDIGPEEVFKFYKARESVEGCFDTAKNVLKLDRTYMHDDLGIMGHNLVTFISLYIWSVMAKWLEDASMTSRCSPEDVLDTYASVYAVTFSDRGVQYHVGKDVRKLDEKLGLGLYPFTKS